MQKTPGFHIEEDDVICVRAEPIHVQRVYALAGVQWASCLVGRNGEQQRRVQYECAALSRYVSTNGRDAADPRGRSHIVSKVLDTE